ncbi:MAG: hypothetical protein UIM25_06260 [Bacteroidales bacterium]|nr:hypothetical protein [Bacteroidales bacterium]
MPERRMFAKTIIDSDAFLDMPISAQLLYFHLSMRADDDGFVNKPKSIMRVCGCKDDDIQILFAKKFVIPFESGIVVIKHWKIHNYIRKDTYTETKYKEEKALLETDENGSYRINYLEPVTVSSRTCNETLTQDRLGKDRLGKDSIEGEQKRKRFVPPTLQEVKDYCSERKNTVDAERFFDYYSTNGWVQGKGKPIKDWKACVRTWERGNGFATTTKKPKESISEHWDKVENRAMPTAEEMEFFKRQAANKK